MEWNYYDDVRKPADYENASDEYSRSIDKIAYEIRKHEEFHGLRDKE